MPTIKHQTLLNHLSQKTEPLPQVFLIFGEPYLVKEALTELDRKLMSHQNGSLTQETLQGGSVSMGDVIEQLMTLSFFSPAKRVLVTKAPLFQAKSESNQISFNAQDLDRLSHTVEKGLPESHYLILTCDAADKRKKIYKTLEKNGLIIDCSVPQGARKADIDQQQAVLQHVAKASLEKSGKKISPPALRILLDRTGFNLDLLVQNIGKLAAFIGHREQIEPADIEAVVKRDKKDPVFSLTNAFMEKDISKCIFYLDSLLNEGFHLLQILKTFENQIRKLLVVKCVSMELLTNDQVQLKGMAYQRFVQLIMPKIVARDKEHQAEVKQMQEILSPGGEKKKAPANDLLLAANPKNAYPVYQLFQKTQNFSLKELYHAIRFLSDLDLKLKSSSFDAKTVIEDFMIRACSKGGFVYASQDQNRRHHF